MVSATRRFPTRPAARVAPPRRRPPTPADRSSNSVAGRAAAGPLHRHAQVDRLDRLLPQLALIGFGLENIAFGRSSWLTAAPWPRCRTRGSSWRIRRPVRVHGLRPDDPERYRRPPPASPPPCSSSARRCPCTWPRRSPARLDGLISTEHAEGRRPGVGVVPGGRRRAGAPRPWLDALRRASASADRGVLPAQRPGASCSSSSSKHWCRRWSRSRASGRLRRWRAPQPRHRTSSSPPPRLACTATGSIVFFVGLPGPRPADRPNRPQMDRHVSNPWG